MGSRRHSRRCAAEGQARWRRCADCRSPAAQRIVEPGAGSWAASHGDEGRRQMARGKGGAAVARRRLTADEYERMGEAGILHEDERVELIEGELIQMAAMGTPHVSCVLRLTHVFGRHAGNRMIVSVQNSFRLSDFSALEPDIVLVRYRDDFYAAVLPRPDDVLLIIEVADTSLRYDRDVKLPLYAAAGIPEVWIVDLQRRRVTVYREPTPEGYQQVIPHTRRARLSPLAFPDLQLSWEDIFGRA